jgi:hypothetical protein
MRQLFKTGFIKNYLDYASRLTDAPENFHIAAAFSLLGSVSGKVWLDFGAFKQKPNLWFLILAPTSRFRKSTVIRIAENVLRRVNDALVLPNEWSIEALFEILGERPAGTFYWSEFGNTLAALGRDYMGGGKEFLSDLYDCPAKRERILRSKTYIVENPYLNILAASSTIWFREKIREGDVAGGFLNRFVFFCENKKDKWMAIPEQPDEKILALLVNDLRIISQFEGALSLSREAYDIYTKWAKEMEDKLDHEEMNSESSIYKLYARILDHGRKFAMLTALAEKSMTITAEHMNIACFLIEFIKREMDKNLVNEFVFDRDTVKKEKVFRLIKTTQGISRAKLLQNSHLQAKTLNIYLDTLVQEERIRIESKNKLTSYWLIDEVSKLAS